ncbi:MAG: tyrosine protein kinase, partial [Bacteroidetes bacterium]
MNNNKELDLKSLLQGYLKHWKWFAFSGVICVALAVLYLRYSVPEYSATAKIQILEESSGTSELSVLDDLNIFSSGKTQMEDEIELINARDNFVRIVKDLGLNVRFFLLGNIKDAEIYNRKELPLSINFLSNDSIISNSKSSFFVKIYSETSFGFRQKEDNPEKRIGFGEKFNTEIGDIIITPNENVSSFKNRDVRIAISPVNDLADYYRKKVIIKANDTKFSNVINLSLEDPIESRAVDIINSLININNSNAVSDKKAIADRTTKFINDRIAEIY